MSSTTCNDNIVLTCDEKPKRKEPRLESIGKVCLVFGGVSEGGIQRLKNRCETMHLAEATGYCVGKPGGEIVTVYNEG